jgi:ribosomal protein L24E
MVSCSFCKKSYHEHKGLVLFTNEGRTVNYCSSKCRRNDDLGRDSKKVNWVKRDKKVKDSKKVGRNIGISEDDKDSKSSGNKKSDQKSDGVRDTKKVDKKVEKKVEKKAEDKIEKLESEKEKVEEKTEKKVDEKEKDTMSGKSSGK